MPRVTYDPSAPVIVIDLLLESADGTSFLLIPVVLDTGASFTVVSTDILVQLGYDPANPLLEGQRIVTGSGVEYAPRIIVRSATAFASVIPAGIQSVQTCKVPLDSGSRSGSPGMTGWGIPL